MLHFIIVAYLNLWEAVTNSRLSAALGPRYSKHYQLQT